jgi:hypothetical protein
MWEIPVAGSYFLTLRKYVTVWNKLKMKKKKQFERRKKKKNVNSLNVEVILGRGQK